MKYTYKKMASGGVVKKPVKKPKSGGYTAEERRALTDLIKEMGDIHSKDVTGSSSVTIIKNKGKRMASGGIVGKSARTYRDMKAGAGSGVGRIQKTKIASRGR
jgi:hypothetical protein